MGLDFYIPRISTPFLGLVSAAFSLYNPHSKGVNSAQRFSPTRSFD